MVFNRSHSSLLTLNIGAEVLGNFHVILRIFQLMRFSSIECTIHYIFTIKAILNVFVTCQDSACPEVMTVDICIIVRTFSNYLKR